MLRSLPKGSNYSYHIDQWLKPQVKLPYVGALMETLMSKRIWIFLTATFFSGFVFSANDLNLTQLTDYRDEIQTYLVDEKRYANDDVGLELGCDILVNEEGRFCVNLTVPTVNIEGGRQYLYATEIGSPLNEDNTVSESHAATGAVTFFIFEVQPEGLLRLLASSATEYWGAYGQPSRPIPFKIGAGPSLAWKVDMSGTHQGYFHSHLGIYARVERQVLNILSIQTDADNSGAVDDEDPNSKIEQTTVDLTLRSSPSKNFADIEARVVKLVKTGKNETKTIETVILSLDPARRRYATEALDLYFK